MIAKAQTDQVQATPATADRKADSVDYSSERILVRVKGRPGAFISTRAQVARNALRVRGYIVASHSDGSFDVVHQFLVKHVPDFLALERFAHSLRASLGGTGGPNE